MAVAGAKRDQNKAAYIGSVMTIVVAGSSVMETTDHSLMEVTGTWLRDNTNFGRAGTLQSMVYFAVSVNGSSIKETLTPRTRN